MKMMMRMATTAKGVLSNKISKEQLEPGDHIYSWRKAYLYAHHGIYVGDGKVIHFTSGAGQEIGTKTVPNHFLISSVPSHFADDPCPTCGDQSSLNGVISSCIDCFLSGGDLHLFHYAVSPLFFLAKLRGGTRILAKSDPPEQVLHRASILLLYGFGVYNTYNHNCENFAVYCKSGLRISVGGSGQSGSLSAAVDLIVSSSLKYVTAGAGVTTGFIGLAAFGCGTYCASRLYSDMGMRRDVEKVAVERLVG